MTSTPCLFHAKILSLFPEMFPGPLGFSVAKRALNGGIWSYEVINIRDFGLGAHKSVDSPQYGGGGGAVLRADVLANALDANLNGVEEIYYFSPRGKPLSQPIIEDAVRKAKVMLICGRFEGVDERLLEEYNPTQVSLGDFILSGGEIAALAFLDACIRILPGTLARPPIARHESFGEGMCGMLEHPIYTKPRMWRNRSVPDELLSGDHAKIERWRREASVLVTEKARPGLNSGRTDE